MAAGWIVGLGVVYAMIHRRVPRFQFQPLLRVGGIASAPLALAFFAFIPGGIGFGIAVLAVVLAALTVAAALQVAFSLPPHRVIEALAPALALWCIILPLFVTDSDPLGAGIFWFSWPF
jgi:hypothetical protein